MNRIYETFSPEETAQIGYKMGQEALPGQCFALIGDLGVGKTAFSEGFARGLEIEGPVASPTFTILMEYDEGRLFLHHFDVYRIGDVTELDEIGFEECVYGDGVTLIEWADLIMSELPDDTVFIRIFKDLDKGFDYRRIEVSR